MFHSFVYLYGTHKVKKEPVYFVTHLKTGLMLFIHMFVNLLREVVVNMLLRLVEHSRVMVLLTYVLDCYRRNTQKWQEVSTYVCMCRCC